MDREQIKCNTLFLVGRGRGSLVRASDTASHCVSASLPVATLTGRAPASYAGQRAPQAPIHVGLYFACRAQRTHTRTMSAYHPAAPPCTLSPHSWGHCQEEAKLFHFAANPFAAAVLLLLTPPPRPPSARQRCSAGRRPRCSRACSRAGPGCAQWPPARHCTHAFPAR